MKGDIGAKVGTRDEGKCEENMKCEERRRTLIRTKGSTRSKGETPRPKGSEGGMVHSPGILTVDLEWM